MRLCPLIVRLTIHLQGEKYLKRRLYLELLFVNSYLNFRQNRRQPTEPNGLSFDIFGIGTAQVFLSQCKINRRQQNESAGEIGTIGSTVKIENVNPKS